MRSTSSHTPDTSKPASRTPARKPAKSVKTTTADVQSEQPVPSSSPVEATTLAVADAVRQYRRTLQLSRDELSGQMASYDHPISPRRLRQIEDAEVPATVDDLVALSFALGVTPTVLLGHLPINTPGPEQPLGSGLPEDLSYLEFQQWLRGETSLDQPTRLAWYQDKRFRLRIRWDHVEDQLEAARDELQDLAVVHEDELDVARVAYLQQLVPELELLFDETERGLRVLEHQIEVLSGRG